MPNKARRDREKRARQRKLILAQEAEAHFRQRTTGIDAAIEPTATDPEVHLGTCPNNLHLPRSGSGETIRNAAVVIELARQWVKTHRGSGVMSQVDIVFRRNDCHGIAKAVRDKSPFAESDIPGIVRTLLNTLDRGHASRHPAAANALRVMFEAGMFGTAEP